MGAAVAALLLTGAPGGTTAHADAPDPVAAADSLTIVAPAEGAQVTQNGSTNVELALGAELAPGQYELAHLHQPDVSLPTRAFTLTDSDISSGTYTLADVLLPYVGSDTLTVTGAGGAPVLDSVLVSVVPAPQPWAEISPDRATVEVGFTGPVTVRLRHATSGTYRVSIEDTVSDTSPWDYSWQEHVWHDGAVDATYTFWVTPFTVAEPHRIVVEGFETGLYAETELAVVQPLQLTADRGRQSRARFYPRVRDGFRDTTNIAYRSNVPATMTARVRNARGVVVRRADLGSRAGRGQWRWNGRTNTGRLARVGRYTIELTGRDRNAYRDVLTRRVRVVTDVVTRSDRQRVRGTRTVSRRASESCYIDGYSGSLRLDCWGGRSAEAVYAFGIPRTAFGVRATVAGEVGCCDSGRITRTGKRTAPRRYHVTVRVTDWRAYTVDSVTVSYSYRQRR